MTRRFLLAIGMVLLSAASAAAMDWSNRLPRLLEEGITAYEAGDYETARRLFHDARLEAPEAPEPVLNLGLTAARMGDHQEAIASFNHARELAERNADTCAKACYNCGCSQFELARQAMELQDREQAIELGIAALESFNKALAEQPDFLEAEYNREQVRNFLMELAQQQQQEQPQPGEGDEQQDQPQDDEEGDQSQQDQQQEGSEEQEQEGEPEKQEGEEEQEQEGQPQPDDGEQQEQQEQQQQGENSEPEAAQGSEEQMQPLPMPEEMTPEEAENLLNLLGNRGLLILRQPRDDSRRSSKDW